VFVLNQEDYMASLATAYGFLPVGNYSQATPTGQLAGPYPRIKSGYAYPIYQGDPVVLGTWTITGTGPYTYTYVADGYIHSLAEIIAKQAASRLGVDNSLPTVADAVVVAAKIPIYGFFKGVNYTPPTSVRSISLSSTGTPMWPAGMVTQGALDARVQVYNDPASLYQVQTGTVGAGPAQVGQSYAANFNWNVDPANTTLITAPFILGNDQTGKSKAFLDTGSAAGTAPGLAGVGQGGFLVADIAPGSEPQQFSVNGTAAPAVPYNSVYVASLSSVFHQKGVA
jgi:hypothetical protein